MTVREIINKEPVWVSPFLSVGEVAQIMKDCGCAFLPILDDGRVVGVVTDRDVAMALGLKGVNPSSTRIREVMSSSPHCVNVDATPDEVAQQMIAHNVRRLVVEEDNRFVGVVSVVDLAGLITDNQVAETLRSLANLNHPRHVDHLTHPIPGQYLG